MNELATWVDSEQYLLEKLFGIHYSTKIIQPTLIWVQP